MAAHCLLRALVVSYFLLLLLAEEDVRCPQNTPCGKLGSIRFPFTNTTNPECGFQISNCADADQMVRLGEKWYLVETIKQNEEGYNSMLVEDKEPASLSSFSCGVFNYALPPDALPPATSIMSFNIENGINLFSCERKLHVTPPPHFSTYNDHHDHPDYPDCDEYDIFYGPEFGPYDDEIRSSFHECSRIQLPISITPVPNHQNPFFAFNLTAKLRIQVIVSRECRDCLDNGGLCRLSDQKKLYCAYPNKEKRRVSKGTIIGLAIACPTVIMIIILIVIRLLYKRKYTSPNVQNQSRNIYSDPYSNHGPLSSSVFFGIPIFSYEQLEEATNRFDPAKQLGEGGFGTVYYGNLRDGREVAVKRLYEQNYKRVEQFMNEIEILTRLHHRNLVSLYGCTSRHSRELLLVYEYIPNGTVACHLYGDIAKPGIFPWPIRMQIAIETATALAYLHASDIIHRDVKTNNILLDNNFCVKVADFGLSRLFPNDVTHVSTAPQGTPGYLDPEYHLCYQLTSKSDVYSFGVVLIELISSMPAVDTTRPRDEINLANLARRKIHNSAISELVDPSLGFESDDEVKRMIVLVAELALRCLQRDKEMRPSMCEVLEELKRIEGEKDEPQHLVEADFHSAAILQGDLLPSPRSPTSLDWVEVKLLKNLKPQRFRQTL